MNTMPKKNDDRPPVQAYRLGRTSLSIGPVPSVEVRGLLPSHIEAISPFIDQLMTFIKKFRTPDGSELDIEIALREALANAVVHGNHENPFKRVYVACRCSIEGEVSITVRDQGLGFNPDSLPDPTVLENQNAIGGRGVFMIRAFMDEVSYEQSGTVVCMRKKANHSSLSPTRPIQ